eukprot:scaffold65297_cov18-Tisochrysis_lutea.AAC.1
MPGSAQLTAVPEQVDRTQAPPLEGGREWECCSPGVHSRCLELAAHLRAQLIENVLYPTRYMQLAKVPRGAHITKLVLWKDSFDKDSPFIAFQRGVLSHLNCWKPGMLELG